MAKIPVDELLRLACIYAECDRQEFVMAYEHIPNDPCAVEAMDFLRQLRAYRKKRWGRTKLEAFVDTAEAVDVLQSCIPGKTDLASN